MENTEEEVQNGPGNESQATEFTMEAIGIAVDLLAIKCHRTALDKGFWNDYYKTQAALAPYPDLLAAYEKTFFAQRLALIHSEVSEACEGDRKDLQDDKLPQYKMKDVELVDTMIRILDCAGKYSIPLGEILLAKMGVNSTREYLHGKAY